MATSSTIPFEKRTFRDAVLYTALIDPAATPAVAGAEAIQAMLAEDPDGENDIPLEQVNAKMDLLIASLLAETKRKLRHRKVG